MRYSLPVGAVLCAALSISACGSSSSKSKPGMPAPSTESTPTQQSSAGGAAIAKVGSCLQGAGYGVTQVPVSDIGTGGAENRGPGQTGELLVGLKGATPKVGADDADAVIAFWDSAAHARTSGNVVDKTLGNHADAIGTVTVQPTSHLALWAAKQGSTPSARLTAFKAQTKKIESCVSPS